MLIPKVSLLNLDLRNREKTRNYVEKVKPKIIFHLAADATEGRSQFTPTNCTERNYLAYLNVLVPAIRSGLEKVVLTSAMSVYGAQKSPFSEKMERKPEDVYSRSEEVLDENC